MKQSITLQLTAQEAVFLIGFKALPRTLTNKVVAAIQGAGQTDEAPAPKRVRNRTKATNVLPDASAPVGVPSLN